MKMIRKTGGCAQNVVIVRKQTWRLMMKKRDCRVLLCECCKKKGPHTRLICGTWVCNKCGKSYGGD